MTDFQRLLVDDQDLVMAGSAQSSELVALLRGTSTGTYPAMPLFGPTFAELEADGETVITIAEIERWIDALPLVDDGGTDGGTDGEVPSGGTALSGGFDQPYAAGAGGDGPDEPDQPDAGGAGGEEPDSAGIDVPLGGLPDQGDTNTPTTAEVFAALSDISSQCINCHGPNTQDPYFASLENFQRLLVDNHELVMGGSAQSSDLVALLRGVSTGTFTAMPPSARALRNWRRLGRR